MEISLKTAIYYINGNYFYYQISQLSEIYIGEGNSHTLNFLLGQKYNIHLGAKTIDADILATNLLNLKNEISGKGSAIIDFATDNTFKLNGTIDILRAQYTRDYWLLVTNI